MPSAEGFGGLFILIAAASTLSFAAFQLANSSTIMLTARVLPLSSAAAAFPSPGEHSRMSSCKLGLASPLSRGLRVAAQAQQQSQMESGALTGVVFEPFNEVKDQLSKVPADCNVSLARHRFAPACEAAINDQINVEYNVSYVYHAMYAYFDRDNVGLPGFAKYFKEASEEEREHAEKFMKYQNLRGGKVKLHSILAPALTEFHHDEKGDALHAMELALAMEKLTNEKLLTLHKVAQENDDTQMQDFIESEFLDEQVDSIRKISVYVSQLRRVGKGHGVYHFDLKLRD